MFGMIPEWAIGVGFIIVMISIGRALAGRVGPGPADRLRNLSHKASRRDLAAAIDELRSKVEGGAGSGTAGDTQARLDELDDMQRRLTDLEERMDFAERMLAKQRDAERIARELGDESRLARVYTYLVNLHYLKGETDAAIDYG